MLTMYLVTMTDRSIAPIAPNPPVPLVPSAPLVPSVLAASAASATPFPPAPPGLLTRAAKSKAHAQMAEVSSFSPFALPPQSSTASHVALGKRHCGPAVESSSDEISDASDEDTPKKTEMPPGVSVPQVNVQMASPPRIEEVNLPVVTGNVCFYLDCDRL